MFLMINKKNYAELRLCYPVPPSYIGVILHIMLSLLAANHHVSSQPPPQALRFSHGRGERETRVTGDEPQGTMGRVQTAGEARCLLPAFLCAHIERDVWVRGRFHQVFSPKVKELFREVTW